MKRILTVRTGFAVIAVVVCCLLGRVAAQDSSQSSVTPPPEQAKRLYFEERVKTTTGASTHCDNYGNCYGQQTGRSRYVSLELTRKIMEKCPSVIMVADKRDAADYDLRISPGSSTLYKQNGDVAYVSPPRFRVSNLAKDICEFVAAHP